MSLSSSVKSQWNCCPVIPLFSGTISGYSQWNSHDASVELPAQQSAKPSAGLPLRIYLLMLCLIFADVIDKSLFVEVD